MFYFSADLQPNHADILSCYSLYSKCNYDFYDFIIIDKIRGGQNFYALNIDYKISWDFKY